MNMNKNTDFFLPPGATDMTEANLAGVPLTVNQKNMALRRQKLYPN